jgi:hypothetical protein
VRAEEPFVRVPRRINEAVLGGEMEFVDFALLVHICMRANYLTNEWRTTAAGLAVEIGWKHSMDTLGRCLKRLRDGDWISYEMRQGKRSPMLIKLTGAAINADAMSPVRLPDGSLEAAFAEPRLGSPDRDQSR